MLQHWTANVDLQAIIDTDQCIRYMAKYAAKGELKSQSASEILSVCVNRLIDTDMASSALRRAMIQVVGERDIGSQKKKLHTCALENRWKTILLHSHFFVCHWMEVAGFAQDKMIMITKDTTH